MEGGNYSFVAMYHHCAAPLLAKLTRASRWVVKRSLSRVIPLRQRPLPGILVVCLCLIVTAATVTHFRYQDQGRYRETRETGT